MSSLPGRSRVKMLHRKVWDAPHLSQELLTDAKPQGAVAEPWQPRNGRGYYGPPTNGATRPTVDRSLLPPTPPSSSSSHGTLALFHSPKYGQADDSSVRTVGTPSTSLRPSQDRRRPSISSVESSSRSHGHGPGVKFPQPPLRDAKMSNDAASRSRGVSNTSAATVTSISSRRPASSKSPAIQACVLGDVTLRDEDDLLRDSLAIIDRDLHAHARSAYSINLARQRASVVSAKSRATTSTVSAAGVQVWPVPLPPPPAALKTTGARARCPVHTQLLAHPDCPAYGSAAGHSGYCRVHGYREVQRQNTIPEVKEPPPSQSFLETSNHEEEQEEEEDRNDLDSVGHWSHSGSSRWSSEDSTTSAKEAGHAQTIDAIVRQYQERVSQQRLAERQAERARAQEERRQNEHRASTSRSSLGLGKEAQVAPAAIVPPERPQRPQRPQRPERTERLHTRDDSAGDTASGSSSTPYPASSTSGPHYGERGSASSRIYRSASSVWSSDSAKHPIPSRSSSVKSKVLRRPAHPPPLPFDSTTLFAKHKSPLDALHASLASYSTEAGDLQRMRSDNALHLTSKHKVDANGFDPSSPTAGASRSKSARAAPVRWPLGVPDRAKAKKIDTNAISSPLPPLPVAVPTLPRLRPLPSFDVPLTEDFGRRPRQPTPPTPTTAAAATAAAATKFYPSQARGGYPISATAAGASAARYVAETTSAAQSAAACTSTGHSVAPGASTAHSGAAGASSAYSATRSGHSAASATSASATASADASTSRPRTGTTGALSHTTVATGGHAFAFSYTHDTQHSAATATTSGPGAAIAAASSSASHSRSASTHSTAEWSHSERYSPATQPTPQEPWTTTRRVISVKKDVEFTLQDQMAMAHRSPTREFQQGIADGARKISRKITPDRHKLVAMQYSPRRIAFEDYDRQGTSEHRSRQQTQQRGIRILQPSLQRSPQQEYYDMHYEKAWQQQMPGSRAIHFDPHARVAPVASTHDTQASSVWGSSFDSALEEGRAGQPRLYRTYKRAMRGTRNRLKELKLVRCRSRQETTSSRSRRRAEHDYDSEKGTGSFRDTARGLRDTVESLPPREKAAIGIAITGLFGAIALIIIGVKVF